MEMSIYKWLIVILLGGMVGVVGMRFLTADIEPAGPTFAQLIDQYGVEIEKQSGQSVRYVGYKKNRLYEDFDSIQLTFTAITDKFERSHELSENKRKATAWDALFCTDKLSDIADEYDGKSNNFLGRVRVITSGVVLTAEGQQGINALCNKNE
ncbi:hypothetical protein [Yersinia mollaretii]|uniref:hypothetical protein n=1 Tax=Yersinia mollaretii TaxID=33060 RepID=UPI0005E2D016|nr:hypothetical protein [Yersinia mollaretii]MDN0109945.1 hypothetical protein [Yersinia mollaretii]PJE89409.1 hypothetical protein CU280_04010 [Yersinia mollaretii]CQD33200.1 Uncharacterised protein [Yersinia mollaretii]CQH08888.1 Uncharacterised protein [Yersinia mollaretii]